MRKLALVGLIFVTCLLIAASPVYVKRGNLWKMHLESNVESSLMLFTDGTFLVATNYLSHAVMLPTGLAFRDHKPSDLLVVVHNHLDISRWSEQDNKTNHWLRRMGYPGPILLRLGNGEVIKWED